MTRINTAECAALLKAHNNYLILTHRSPDGDTLGSAFALHRALNALGKKCMVRCEDEIPQKFLYLAEGIDNGEIEYDKIIAVDIADRRLLGEGFNSLYGDSVFIAIDHHMSHRGYAKKLLLEDRAATAEIVYAVIGELGVTLDSAAAGCIYTGLATDTGCFMFSNTTPDTHRIAAELMEAGADCTYINRVMFDTKTMTYLKLEQLALGSIEYHFDGKCAVMTITREMFRKSGSDESECDGIASLPRKIEGVAVGVTLRERADGSYKVSVRTIEPYDASKICAGMGGGGHNRAAGCEFDGDPESGKKALLAAIGAELL